VPEGAPQCKLDAIETYGGRITRCAATVSDREATCARLQRETGATLIPPYDHPDVIAGQGTIGVEFLEQVPDLDAVIVPVSGGGMISGIALAVKALNPNCLVLAAEPGGEMGNRADCYESKRVNEVQMDMPPPVTIADGLRARLGYLTWPVVRDKVDDVLVVSELDIVNAMKLIYERMKLVVEPSGAAGLAAALSESFKDFNAKNAGWGQHGTVPKGRDRAVRRQRRSGGALEKLRVVIRVAMWTRAISIVLIFTSKKEASMYRRLRATPRATRPSTHRQYSRKLIRRSETTRGFVPTEPRRPAKRATSPPAPRRPNLRTRNVSCLRRRRPYLPPPPCPAPAKPGLELTRMRCLSSAVASDSSGHENGHARHFDWHALHAQFGSPSTR
jgi:hypothetical protein